MRYALYVVWKFRYEIKYCRHHGRLINYEISVNVNDLTPCERFYGSRKQGHYIYLCNLFIFFISSAQMKDHPRDFNQTWPMVSIYKCPQKFGGSLNKGNTNL